MKPARPPLLIMSLPRSGSSWVAEILGSAPEALFLREPINQSHLACGGATTVFDIDPAAPPPCYAQFATRAFAGIPAFPAGVVRDARQWKLTRRTRGRVVVKEVNPLALAWLLDTYRPRIVFLMRHPAAVALSYEALNWCNAEAKLAELGARLMDSSLRPWQETIQSVTGFLRAHGAFQGAVLHVALQALTAYADARIVTYESLCENPEAGFRALFEFAGLTFDDRVRDHIGESSIGTAKDTAGHYGTRRNTLRMAAAWKGKLTPEQLAGLHAGYAAFDLPYYRGDDHWTLAA